jgi:hypothetical protein
MLDSLVETITVAAIRVVWWFILWPVALLASTPFMPLSGHSSTSRSLLMRSLTAI